MSRQWDEAEDDILKTMWIDGASATQIRRKLPDDRSRSAVLGRVHRLQKDNVLAQRATVPRARERIKHTDPLLTVVRTLKAPVEDENDPGPADPPIDTMTVRDIHCRWPYDVPGGGYHYCGQTPKKDSSFCACHHRRAHMPYVPKRSAA